MGAYAWDSSRNDEIAEGITIGGVDVGGMTDSEAQKAVEKKLVDPLRGPVTVHFEGVKYRLSAEKLEISSDVDGMVDQALDESRAGGLPTRVWRYATGGEVDAAISPQITYSNEAIDEFIAKVAEAANRDPVDASIEPTTASLSPVPAQDGVSIDEGKLRSRIERAVQSPRQRDVTLPVHRVEPEVTQEELAAKYPTYITVDRSSYTATLWVDLKQAKQYTVAIGQPAYPTPTGLLLDRLHAGRSRSGASPTRPGPGSSPGPRSQAAPPGTRSRRAGWGSPTGPASTAPTTSARWAPPLRTAACGCRSRT